MAVAIVVVVATAMALVGNSNLNLALRNVFAERAAYAAEAGLARAMLALAKAPPPIPLDVASETLVYSPTSDGYSVEVFDNTTGPSPLEVPGHQIHVPVGTIYLLSTGYARSGPDSDRATRQAGALIQRANGDFQVGALAKTFSVTGGQMDAYDSSLGDYSPGSKLAGYDHDLAATNESSGVVATVTMGSIEGRLKVGPGGDYQSMVHDVGGGIKGGPANLAQTLDMPEFTTPAPSGEPLEPVTLALAATTLAPGEYGPLTVALGDVTLQSGVYVFDSLTLAQGRINFSDSSGSVTIYVRNGFTMQNSNGLLNSTRDPKKFRINYEGTAPALVLGGNSAYCTFVAPNADVTLVAGQLFGGLATGKQLNLLAGAFHYDKALQGAAATGPGKARIIVLGVQRF